MEQPLVSILVPIFNVEKYIKRCVTSLMQQGYRNIEYVFVNDCTQDNSISILVETLKEYPQRTNIKIINHESNKGLAASRNTGILNSKGTYISFVDSDDYLEPNAIEIMVKKAIETSADIVIGNFQFIINSSKKIFKRPKNRYDKIEYIQAILRWNEIDLTLWGKLIKRELFSHHNINSFDGYNFGEDFAVTSRISYFAKNIYFLNEVVYNYEYSNQNSYTKKISEKSIQSLIYIAHRITQFYVQQKDFLLFKKHLFIGLVRMQLWIYSNTSNANNYIKEIQSIIVNNKLKSKGKYQVINFLITNQLGKVATIINRI